MHHAGAYRCRGDAAPFTARRVGATCRTVVMSALSPPNEKETWVQTLLRLSLGRGEPLLQLLIGLRTTAHDPLKRS
jgi:hypothetical protein